MLILGPLLQADDSFASYSQRTREAQSRDTRLIKAGATSGSYMVITETAFFKARTQYSGVCRSHSMVVHLANGYVGVKALFCPS